jgi:hypothetical protein
MAEKCGILLRQNSKKLLKGGYYGKQVDESMKKKILIY